MRPVSWTLGAVLVVLGSPAAAQYCEGAAPFSAGMVQVGAGLGLSEDVKQFGGHLSLGAVSGPYCSIGVSTIDYADVTKSSTGVGLSGGYSIPLRGPLLAMCPTLGFSSFSGPDFETGFGKVELSTRSFSIGASVGGLAAGTSSFDLVPHIAAHFVTAKSTARFGQASESASEDYFNLGAGVGFVLQRAFTIRLGIALPVGLDNSDPTFGVGFAFNFGIPSSASR